VKCSSQLKKERKGEVREKGGEQYEAKNRWIGRRE
jgi:hypothetical protein